MLLNPIGRGCAGAAPTKERIPIDASVRSGERMERDDFSRRRMLLMTSGSPNFTQAHLSLGLADEGLACIWRKL